MLQTSTLLDGKRRACCTISRLVEEGGKIVSMGPGASKADYDLRGLTLMPGWIDTHVHLQWHMDANHKAIAGGVNPEEMELYTAADAWLDGAGRVHDRPKRRLDLRQASAGYDRGGERCPDRAC